MGAFLLIKKQKNLDVKEVEPRYRDSMGIFEKKGLTLNQRIVTDEFLIYVFHKHRFQVDNVMLFDNDQFIISTGTCIYNGKIGRDALKDLYHDFSEKGEFLSNIFGEYCLIISKNGKLYLLNDYTGLYHVYSNKSKSVISSSFLGVLKTLKEKSIAPQEFYEYVINGSSYGDKTVINEIELIDSRSIWQLSPVLSAIPKAINDTRLDTSSSFDEMTQEFSNDLVDYFSILKANFGDSICSGLSGGFDSRLMLALMQKVGIRPYLYIYGKEDCSVGRDANAVKIAKSIAKSKGLTIEHEDKGKFPKFEVDEFPEILEKQYYMFDGLGHEDGIFDNGADLYTRLKRTDQAKLQLNGGGGEIFRNYWILPDRSFHIKSFLKSRYDRIDYSICSDYFDKHSYFSTLQEKIKLSLNTDENRIDRQQIEMLQPQFELKYWMGNNNSLNNQLSYSLTPYADTRFVFRGCNIPLKFKHLGVFEAALIKLVDPDLAKYPSSHGYNFYDDIKASIRVNYFVRLYMPIWLRAYVRKRFYNRRDERLMLSGDKCNFPFYLTKEYLDRIFISNGSNVSKYVHVDKINDPDILSRALSVELIITDRY